MNRQEFSGRVLRMEGRLYRIGYGMLHHPQDAMDAAQEAVLKAWSNLHKLRQEQFFETWLTRILIHECLNLIKARKKLIPLEAAPEIPAPEGADSALHDALMALPTQLRLPIILHYMEGYRIGEIAQILKLPEGTIKSRMKRARKELKQQLGEEADL